MSHPFGDLLTQHLHRKHGLSQAKLAAGIVQDPAIIARMCKGERLIGPQARERMIAIVGWLHRHGALDTIDEANALLAAAGMAALRENQPAERTFIQSLRTPNLAGLGDPQGFAPKTNLPALLTSLIGRERELAKIGHVLAEHRLVTMTGAGGVGKTRLAIEVAHGVHASASGPKDGVWFVELASLREPDQIPNAIATTLRLPPTPRVTTASLCDTLHDMAMLIVLDNCEHLADACAPLVEQLLQQCWRVRVLATIREPLRVPGEHVYRVPSLALPDVNDTLDNASAQLFIARASESAPAFHPSQTDAALIAQICRRLDGIPLAIELAAALTRTLPLPQIAASLDHQLSVLTSRHRTTTPRHQTMRSAIAWSYNLLSPPEQRLFARLSVFVGGWTREAAIATCADDALASTDVPRVLDALLEKSLVQIDESASLARVRMLEPIRQFALEALVGSGEEHAIRRAHANYFLGLVEDKESTTDEALDPNYRATVDHERANLGAAFRWAQGNDTEIAYRFSASPLVLWRLHPSATETLRHARATLALELRDPTPELLTAKANTFERGGYLATELGQYDLARSFFAQSLELRYQLEDEVDTACTMRGCAFVAMLEGDLSAAAETVERSLALCRRIHNDWGIADSIYDLGVIRWMQGDLMGAERLLAEALAGAHAMRNRWRVFRCSVVMAAVLTDLGEIDRVETFYRDALPILKQRGGEFTGQSLDALEELAALLAQSGDVERAVVLFAATAKVHTLRSEMRSPFFQRRYARNIAQLRSRFIEAEWDRLWAEGQRMTGKQLVDYALGALNEATAETAHP